MISVLLEYKQLHITSACINDIYVVSINHHFRCYYATLKHLV